MSFDIISKDSLRKQIELASDNKVTVLYDDKGYPSFMCVIPRMKVGECFPEGASSLLDSNELDKTHPAFKVFDATSGELGEVSEIFIGQYRSHIIYSSTPDFINHRAVSLPGLKPDIIRYRNSEPKDPIHLCVESKGPNWHMMNIWEYSLLQFWAYKNNIEICGNQDTRGSDIYGRSGSVAEITIILDETTAEDDGWEEGERVYGRTSGAAATLNVIRDYNAEKGERQLILSDNYGLHFEKNEEIEGLTSGTVGIIKNIKASTLTGYGPSSWTHNSKYSGVWDLASGPGELVDGVRLKNYTVTDKELYLLQLTSGNYYHWDEDLLKTLPVKYSIAPDTTNTFQLAYQNINSSGVPIGNLEDDVNIDPNIQYLYQKATAQYRSDRYIQKSEGDGSIPAVVNARRKLILAGLDVFDFPDSNINRLHYGKINYYPYVSEWILAKGYNQLATSTTYRPSSTWTHEFVAITLNPGHSCFRICYIP